MDPLHRRLDSRPTRFAGAALALALAVPAVAQDRPSEEELFGAPARGAEPAPPSRGKPEPSRAAPEEATRPEESQLFGAPPAAQAAQPPPQGVISREREDTLKVGGTLYLRATSLAIEDQEPGKWRLSSPNLLDLYVDARPNDRVRGFALGRLDYDPTLVSGASGLGVLDSFLAGSSLARPTANPSGVLDQLWVNFDVGRRAFVTAGRQHAKWGVGRFWNPTDYLHPVKRDPLAVFDVRTGTTMVKVHVPWEARGWNVYGVAVLEDLAGDPPRDVDPVTGQTVDGTNRLGRVGVGGRAEVVLGSVEVGADALVQDRHRPRFGVDVSAGVWDLDVYAEAALRTSVDTPRWRAVPNAAPGVLVIERHDPLGFTPQLTAGATYAVKYSDEDAVTFGAEYFYDRSGYDDPRLYPALLTVAALGAVGALPGEPNPFTPFYLGRHYAGAFVSLPAPGRWNDTTFTLSVLGNLSDRSFVGRLDHSVLALTYLRVETYVAGRFGARDGEFRLGLDAPPTSIASSPMAAIPAFRTDPFAFEAGVALRVSL